MFPSTRSRNQNSIKPMKPAINFKHNYLKLIATGGKAKLLLAVKVPFSGLTKDFIEYDTKYIEGTQTQYFQLQKSEFMILLIFKTYTNKLFTTIRSYNKEKWNYYKKLQGSIFEIVIENKAQNAQDGRMV